MMVIRLHRAPMHLTSESEDEKKRNECAHWIWKHARRSFMEMESIEEANMNEWKTVLFCFSPWTPDLTRLELSHGSAHICIKLSSFRAAIHNTIVVYRIHLSAWVLGSWVTAGRILFSFICILCSWPPTNMSSHSFRCESQTNRCKWNHMHFEYIFLCFRLF